MEGGRKNVENGEEPLLASTMPRAWFSHSEIEMCTKFFFLGGEPKNGAEKPMLLHGKSFPHFRSHARAFVRTSDSYIKGLTCT